MDATFEPPAKHHEKHWSAFGDVVLVGAVESWQSNTILFRVHSVILSERSEVFASMFALPQGEGSGQKETYDGLPLVRLPDTSKQVCAMLDAIRDPLILAERTLNSDTPIRIRDALHMSTKYIMTEIRTKLVKIVESEWPTTVGGLEIMDQSLHDFLNDENTTMRERNYEQVGWPMHFVPEPAAAIWVAEEYYILSILPAAHYDILRCSPREDWDSFDWFDENPPNPSHKPARWEVLSRKSLRKMHRLQDFLADETDKHFHNLSLGTQIENCNRRSGTISCVKIWDKLVSEHRRMPARVQERDLLKQLKDLRVCLSDSNMCFSCEDTCLQEIFVAREGLWNGVREICLEDEHLISD